MADPNDPGLIAFFAEAASALHPAHKPWPRYALEEAGWRRLVQRLGENPSWDLLDLWAEPGQVHAALRDATTGEIAVASLDCPGGTYPSLAAVRPGASRLERAARDLFGIDAADAADRRPWIDHGRWPVGGAHAKAPYEFLPVDGEGLHVIPVGPVHAGIIEPGHFRFTASGETVVRLEERLGYVHKGIEGLMAGRTPADAARFASRISGDSAVAHALAFARAVEAALGVDPPPRAVYLRALMAELERIANHLGDFGAICNDVSFALLHAKCGELREAVLRLADAAFGHRLMMDRVVPGGVARDIDPAALPALAALVGELKRRVPYLARIYDGKASIQDRTVTTGTISPVLAMRFAAGGFVGRAAGRDFDARRACAYPPYDRLKFDVPVLSDGDVNARVWIRVREIEQSLGLIEQIVAALPEGPIAAAMPLAGGEGMAMVEGFRGEVLCWVRIDPAGTILRARPRDPSWLQWPLLEAAIKDNIVADFPVCNKSFNCSYAGHDL
ncbi:MAG: nickel-dependent hydrogenase large subunit [Alphaproteobacteria bacterium]|nr:nickel-dependent hydrogenase large subunit [Alphaproteobacteria bacterium]